MPRLLRIVLMLAIASTLHAAPAPGSDLNTAQVVAGLQAWLDGTRDLEGRFEQRIVSGAFGAGSTEKGKLALLRPGRMRWDYESPEKKVALVNGEATPRLPAGRAPAGCAGGWTGRAARSRCCSPEMRASAIFSPVAGRGPARRRRRRVPVAAGPALGSTGPRSGAADAACSGFSHRRCRGGGSGRERHRVRVPINPQEPRRVARRSSTSTRPPEPRS